MTIFRGAALVFLWCFLNGCCVANHSTRGPLLIAKASVNETASAPVIPSVSASPCVDDLLCTPWIRRKDVAEFDAGMGLPSRGVLGAGRLYGYDGRVYRKLTCAVHKDGPVCFIDLWEVVPSDGWEYSPDLFSRIYNERVALFNRFNK